ncbi:uncharacterized protein N0V89_003512 [Didymosphaeria variabile]|uniref:Uncharacterized protein n=1 Tax=Didymosphaeria variabile TaxID=1932322 RepID=A0A9W9CCT2_9PLEO|nr:uncharacterized protein N0V89_003512 [Didymosphaeria variabile]KAJ4355496.1 hypothetical protein N0V89_003512 [Didymosphaeria variabile]
MLLRTQHLDATDPKDKIFAVHGLLSQLGAHLPDPDYSKSIQLVYQEAATVAINHDNRLHILASLTGESGIEGLPSWVPDWSCNRPISEIASWDDYNVKRATKPWFKFSADGKRLKLWGAEVDKIEEHSIPFVARYNFHDVVGHGYPIREIRILQRWFERLEEDPHPTSLVEFFSGLSEKPWTRMKSQFNLSTDVLSKYWIKAIKRFKKDGWTYNGARYIDADLRWRATESAMNDGMKEKHVRGDITPFHDLMRTLLDRKVMFVTKRGHLGIASQAIQDDDRIVFFRGVSLPMVVRQVKSKWRLVAPAYIHNGMEDISNSETILNKLQALLVTDQVQKFDIV